ncbi:MocR-like pyridoxine biosynthesis transcription factor PdxR [Oceanobacillus jeddahense]|uniref:PLP-dependent aminotransferase family protein n=1 Tax=Oceanobacillus jeddahense TaxID=1462527 RepID=A0ABY5JPQ0_9BACI|nr:PLP-dependent aminotransferase family protein [Oceanobacillus jeddahense]UUI02270.1 PLP-dependent aminotransferase family protein [Oceanobacillus jeddahense]
MDLLSVHLDKTIDIPLYEQLYEFIKQEIVQERLPYGQKLPSKRKLANHLEVSQNTVETAFEQLLAEGYITSQPRKGFYVLAHGDLEFVEHATKKEISKVAEDTAILFDFSPNKIDTEAFPFSAWRKLNRQVIDETNHDLLLLGEAQGDKELREAIAHYVYHARGIDCDPDTIVVGAGIEVLMQQLLSLLSRSTIFGIEDPGYQLMMKLITHFGFLGRALDMNEEGVSIEAIRLLEPDYIYVTPSNHFPYGTVTSINRRNQLLQWANEAESRYIIEDDYDSEFRYTGKTIPPMKKMDFNDRVIYLGSFSKSLIPSLRISYMILPKSLLEQYRDRLTFHHSTVSRIDQHVLAHFIQEGYFEKHLNRMRKIYRKKFEFVNQLFDPYTPSIQLLGEQSGLHVVCEVRNGLTEKEILRRAEQEGIKIYPISYYASKNAVFPYPQFVIGFAGIAEERLEEAVQHIIKILQQ